jgi:hypothetical protein
MIENETIRSNDTNDNYKNLGSVDDLYISHVLEQGTRGMPAYLRDAFRDSSTACNPNTSWLDRNINKLFTSGDVKHVILEPIMFFFILIFIVGFWFLDDTYLRTIILVGSAVLIIEVTYAWIIINKRDK